MLKNIDLLKFFFAVCVIAIHTFLFLDVNYTLYKFTLNMILFLAVPFFFSVSGYFFGKKINKNPKEIRKIFKDYCKKLLTHYLFWGCLYFIVTICIFIVLRTKENIPGLIMSYLLGNPNAAMWYVPALLLSILIILLLKDNKKYLKTSIFSSLVILVIIQIISLFIGNFPNTTFERIVNFIFVDTKNVLYNVLYYAYFFVTTGYYIGRYGEPNFLKNVKNNIIFVVIGIVINVLFTIIQLNQPISETINANIPLGNIFIILNLMLLAIKLKNNTNYDTKIIRKMSETIYYMHYFILIVVKVVQEYIFNIENNTLLFVLTTIITIGMSYMLNRINNKYINKII